MKKKVFMAMLVASMTTTTWCSPVAILAQETNAVETVQETENVSENKTTEAESTSENVVPQTEDVAETVETESGIFTIQGSVLTDYNQIEGVTEVIIPDGITTIGEYAFSGCSNITSVMIPDSVTSIEEGAFFDCESLEKAYIPSSVTSIAYPVFYYGIGWESLPNLTIYAETGSWAQQYRYYDANVGEGTKLIYYVPTNEAGNTTPYVIPYFEEQLFNESFMVKIEEDIIEINKTYPLELRCNNNVVMKFPTGSVTDIGYYDFYVELITDIKETSKVVQETLKSSNIAEEEFVSACNIMDILSETGKISIPVGNEWIGKTLYCYGNVNDTYQYTGQSGVVDENGILTITSNTFFDVIATTVPDISDIPDSNPDDGNQDNNTENDKPNSNPDDTNQDNNTGNIDKPEDDNNQDNTEDTDKPDSKPENGNNQDNTENTDKPNSKPENDNNQNNNTGNNNKPNNDTGNNNSTGKDESPKTGQTTSAGIWTAFLSMSGMIGLFVGRKGKKE